MEYAKCDKSLLNYCHMSQLEPRITQLPYKKAPGLRGVHFLQYGVIYVLKRTSYLVVFIFCSTGLFTFSSEPRTSWCLFFAVWGYLRSQANLVPRGVYFLQYGVISYLMVFIFCSTGLFTFSSEPRTSWCSFFAVRGYLRSQVNLVPRGVHFLQYGAIYVLKRTSYIVVFIFCSTGLFTFSSEPRTSWCSFFAVRGYLRSQANLVPRGVHFLQYRVIYILKRTSYLMVFIFCSTGLFTFSSEPRTYLVQTM